MKATTGRLSIRTTSPRSTSTLFVVDTEEVEETYVNTAALRSWMSLPISCVLHPRPVRHRNTRKVMASTVGTGVPKTCSVRAGSLPVGLALPPDAPCPAGRADSADTSLSALPAVWGVQNGTSGPISGAFRHQNHPCFSYETGLTCRLTGQGAKWDTVLK